MPPLSRSFGTIKVNALAWTVPAAPSALGGEKKVNGDFVLWPKLMNSPVVLGKILQISRQ
jgi:hypothetical protein